MARKMDSAITLAISSIALKTFLWQELMLLQLVGSYRTLSFFVILGPARHRKTPTENFTVAHVPVCQLKTLVTYMNIL